MQGRSKRGTVHAGVAPRAHRYQRGLHKGDALSNVRNMLFLTDEIMEENRSSRQNNFLNSRTVLLFFAILVRIRILTSVPRTNGSGSGRPRNLRLRIRNTGTFTSFFKDQKSQRSEQTVEIKVFLLFFLDDGRIRTPEPDPYW